MFKSLDFIYVPAPDIEASVRYYTQVIGGELLWKIHAYGVWVACVELSEQKTPYVLLADHIERKDIMMIYQVENLGRATADLKARGWAEEKTVEIPLAHAAHLETRREMRW